LVTTGFSRGGNTANAVVAQANGRIVVGGWSYGKGFALARYLHDGSLDPSFGRDGKVTTNFPTGPAVITDLALQPDGRIIAVGFSEGFVAMARYRADGRLDESFGRHGVAIARYRRAQTSVEGVALQRDGDVVVVGSGGVRYWLIARFDPRGRLDRGFGANGWTAINFGSGEEGARDAAITRNGRIVVSGAGGGTFALARLRRRGTIDPQFGDNGRIVTGFRYRGAATAVALRPDGKILAGGYSGGRFALTRYLPSGALDRSFGDAGRAAGPSVDGSAYDMAVQSGGGILLAGSAYQDFTAARYTRAGRLDTTFGDQGVVHTSFPNYGPGKAIAVQPNGRFVIGGDSGLHFAVARYLA
jgi:uncharacterized delta-60 repeat protein